MKKYILIIFTLFACSCASRINVNAPYEDSKKAITEYFKKRALPLKNETTEITKLKSPFYEARLIEENDEAEWILNLGSRYSKSDAILPKILELVLVERSKNCILYAKVKKHDLFTSERKIKDEKEWLKLFKKLIEEK
ncbi:MAG: hypothetical protein HRT88_22880 [Lentisphaeraceae bacterium]|nr:hypothetical protein [Lentisphaeraceae bacterium]